MNWIYRFWNIGYKFVIIDEPSERRILGKRLDTHGLAGLQADDGGVPGLDELGQLLGGLASPSVTLLLDLSKLQRTNIR